MGFLSWLFGNDRPKKPPVVVYPPSPPIDNENNLPIDPDTQGGVLSNSEDTSTRHEFFDAARQALPLYGPFNFPHPYNTRACKITWQGNVARAGYSYWRQINAHRNSDRLKVAISIDNQLNIFELDKGSLDIVSEKGLLPHSGEGIFFSRIYPDDLYFTRNNELIRVDVAHGSQRVLASVDGNEYLSQVHATFDESRFSGTVRDVNSGRIKDWIVINDSGAKRRFGAEGEPDECQIDKSGKWLFIKEDNDNRLINLETDEEYVITNQAGALGHSDCGFYCAIGEDDYNDKPGAVAKIDFPPNGNRNPLYFTNYWNLGHVSFTNATPGDISSQKALISPSGDEHSRGQELVSIRLDGTGNCLIICPALTEMWDYENSPKASLCPYGQYALWTAYVNGRKDAFIVKIPNW